MTISLRGISQPVSGAQLFTRTEPIGCLEAALAANPLPDEAVLYWPDTLDLRAVDLDWHGHPSPPSTPEVERLLASVRPSPAYFWTTHGGGGRLIYAGVEPFTASELAACAVAWALGRSPGATAEVKCDTRHPRGLRGGKAAGQVIGAIPDTALPILGRFSARGCTEGDRDAWLAERAMTVGGVYPHDLCPIDRTHASANPAPVWAGDNGVFCHSCHARTGHGFRSYGALAGSVAESSAPIYEAARHFAHWEQADYYFRELAADIPRGLAKSIYAALLKTLHPDETKTPARINRCLVPFAYVRGEGEWLHADTLRPRMPRLHQGDLKRHPWAAYWGTDKGEPVLLSDGHLVGRLEGNGLCPGLTPILPVRGAPIFGVHNRREDLDGSILATPRTGREQVRYVHGRDRLPLPEAWTIVDRYFPGLSHQYLILLHVARGCAEYGVGMLPMVYCKGPSGSGKTQTCAIECAMSGETLQDVGQVQWDRISEAIGEAADRGGHIVVNEFSKLNKSCRGEAVNVILQLGRSHTYRKTGTGVRTIPVRAYVLMTDTDLPYALRSHEQFGRRPVYVPLNTVVEGWDQRVDAAAWSQFSEETYRAACAIHSWVVDEYFPADCRPVFQELAAGLGFLTLDKHFADEEDGELRISLAKRLFAAVCASKFDAPEDWKWGPGFKEAHLERPETDLGGICGGLVGLTEEEVLNYSTVEGALAPLYGRWHKIIGSPCPVKCELRKNGTRVFMRFRSDTGLRQGYATNGEVLEGDTRTAVAPITPLQVL